ncbi:MAG TPA: SDR family NAD(P)-dependent oxidoreductase, partial [Cellvibrio sp.]|nr:SDR family NAD(P)-dependent oxidoreductase [Cellvibrio sp.]
MQLESQSLLITGGTSGIGYELVKNLADKNKKIIVIARDKNKLCTLNDEFKNLFCYSCSLATQSQLATTLATITAEHPDINVIFNNAGIQFTPQLNDADFIADTVATEIATNLTAPIAICAHFIRIWGNRQQPAAIVNISSGLAFYPKKNSAVYCATKAGLHNFTKSLRYQLENTPINVHEAILPLVDTPMTQQRSAKKISAAFVAQEIICGVEKNRAEIYVGKTKFIP